MGSNFMKALLARGEKRVMCLDDSTGSVANHVNDARDELGWAPWKDPGEYVEAFLEKESLQQYVEAFLKASPE